MGFVLTEEQESIRKSARAFVRDRLPAGHLRRLRDEKDPLGYSREIWRDLAGMGVVDSNSSWGMAGLGLVLEECGRTLAPTPFISTVLLSMTAIELDGSREQKEQLPPAMQSGELVVAFAHEEGNRFAEHSIATTAVVSGSDLVINGQKSFVIDGFGADGFIVVGRSSGMRDDPHGLTLAYVAASNKGITVSRLHTADSRNVAQVRFDNVRVPASSVIGEVGNAWPTTLAGVLEFAQAGLAAEMLGGIQEMFELTLQYLKTRKQFGVVIGSFQALKHRAAYMFCEIELTKSAVYDAVRALDEHRKETGMLISAAKARANDTFLLVSSEAIQMHGGIGATDELDVGFYYKRARVADLMFGDSAFHRDRFAKLSGY